MRLKVYGYAAFVGVLTLAGVVLSAQSGIQVFRVRDDCDPATFNAGPPDGPGLGILCNPSSTAIRPFSNSSRS